MVKQTIYTLPLLFLAFLLPAQQFELLTIGDIVTSNRDSRSCNFIDLNGDGFDDLFFSNGPSSGQNNQLYWSIGDGTFQTVTNDPIVEDNGKSDGATFADMDNDGDLDAFVVTWYGQRNFFYRNNGDNTFSFEADTGNDVGTYSETASWGDYDNDGWLDLLVTNSTDFVTNTPAIKRNQLWHNTNEGNLERVELAPITSTASISRNVQWVDYDLDGDQDVFISNEENEANQLFRNNGGTFTEASDNATFGQFSSTGSSWADVDNDGDFDLFVANYNNQNNQLFLHQGDGQFMSVSSGDLVSDGGCSFGSAFADYDNDGDLDLFVANGFCTTTQNFLYDNDGAGNFIRNTTSFADLSTECAFGAAWGDFNNDGFLDLAVANCRKNTSDNSSPNSVFRNLGNSNAWVKFSLEGSTSNRSAIGARLRLLATINGEAIWQTRAIEAQTGYNGQNSLQAHFGLADATLVDSLIIYWPSGTVSELGQLMVATTHHLVEPDVNSLRGHLDRNELQLRVFPNPSEGVVQLALADQSNWPKGAELKIVNNLGQQVAYRSLEQGTDESLHFDLPSGIYRASVSSGLKLLGNAQFVVE